MAKKAHQHSHECAHGHSFDLALDRMKESGLKRTKSREVILRYLVNHHGPFSAKELQDKIEGKAGRSALDTVTVYRCLSSFEEAGIVRRCDFGDGIARFELKAEGEHHHHVICTSCRKIEKLEDCQLEKLEAKVKALGYTKIHHVLEFSGLCRSCAKMK